MSSFRCEYCQTDIIDTPNGYVTWCAHYPMTSEDEKNHVCFACPCLSLKASQRDDAEAEVQRLRAQVIHDAEYSNRLSRQLKVYHDAVVLRPFKMFAVPDADPVAIPETGSLAALLEVQAQHDRLVTRILDRGRLAKIAWVAQRYVAIWPKQVGPAFQEQTFSIVDAITANLLRDMEVK